MSERLELARKALDEIRELSENPAQIDQNTQLVWVLSSPGTVYEPVSIPNDIYKGLRADFSVVQWGVDLVRNITAMRLKKNISEVSKLDIEESGPVLYYNGEDENTENKNYDQNDAFRRFTKQPNFPIPESKIVIGTIDKISTPPQILDFAKFIAQNPDFKKIAVVSMIHFSVRVGRYLQHYLDLFPKKIEFTNNPSPAIQRPVGMIHREVRKIIEYYERGHLAKESWFTLNNPVDAERNFLQ